MQAVTGHSSGADRIAAGWLGVQADLPWRQQRFLLDASVTAYKHQTFDYLDFNAEQYRAAWQWHATPRVQGLVSADRTEALVNYADVTNVRQRNVRVTESEAASADARLFGGWYATGGVHRVDSRTETPVADIGSFTSKGASVGGKYVSGAGTSLALSWRRTQGRYVDQVINPATFTGDFFTRDDLELLEHWPVTLRSTIDARVAAVRYQESPFSQRDFSGTEGRFAWSWTPTGRLSGGFELARLLTPWRDLTATYREENRLVLRGAWQLTGRLTLGGNVQTARSRFFQPIVPQPTAREDTYTSGALTLDWQVLRRGTVSASLRREERDSTVPGRDYRQSVATLSGSLAF